MTSIDRTVAWNWIVNCYEQPGAADPLLRRQQESDLDIVLHLFDRYVREVVGIQLDAKAIEEARDSIATWRNQVIKPIRSLRRELKTMTGLEMIDPTRHALRESIKGMELQAERVEFMSLCNWLESRTAGAGIEERLPVADTMDRKQYPEMN